MGSSLILDNNFDNLNLPSLRIGIIRAEWNSQITDLLMMSCRNYFLEVGIDDKNIITRKVPGSMELVYASNHMLINHDIDGIVTLGCIIKGETSHYHYLCHSVIYALISLSIKSKKPIGNGILTCSNKKQAFKRADPKKKNKGGDAANAAISVFNIIK